MLSLMTALLRVPVWLTSSKSSRRRHEQSFFSIIAKGFGLTILQHGTSSARPGTLFIINHISWADIPAVLALIDADFVAKADMLDWPVIGRLARRFDPVFVQRDKRQLCPAQADAIRARLRTGRSVILCPEGTTSTGTTILPFRSSLFAAADAAQVIQPVVLNYLTPEGATLSPTRQREVAWIDNDDLLSGAARFADSRTMARVEFLPAIKPYGHRKQLAENARQLMLAAYAAAPNRPR